MATRPPGSTEFSGLGVMTLFLRWVTAQLCQADAALSERSRTDD